MSILVSGQVTSEFIDEGQFLASQTNVIPVAGTDKTRQVVSNARQTEVADSMPLLNSADSKGCSET